MITKIKIEKITSDGKIKEVECFALNQNGSLISFDLSFLKITERFSVEIWFVGQNGKALFGFTINHSFLFISQISTVNFKIETK